MAGVWIWRAMGAALMSGLPLMPAAASVVDKPETVDGTVVRYEMVLPNHYDAAKSYPAILAFPPGDQKIDLVDDMIESTWREQAERRGYIVIEPAAPGGDRFFEKGERIFPAFLEHMLAQHKIENGKFHIAGISAGGTSAFWIAEKYPQYFYSVSALPGSLREPTPERMSAFSNMCIYMFVGEHDAARTREDMQSQADAFKAMGYPVQFAVERGQEHVMVTLTGRGAARLFAQFEQARQPHCGVSSAR